MRRSIETKLNQYFFIQSVNLKNNSKAKILPRPPESPRAALRKIIIIRTKKKKDNNTKRVNRFIQEW